ncbi:unnamed protein product [Prorocentrum cordatum]|uniref:EF-hand domain-containing protein n=2 Tax=Prorocentrum cordatum TaxID=2364126 RepID=A0ABN9R0W4_9DINO|nr:unnamed protein product [Polarella glacialis]
MALSASLKRRQLYQLWRRPKPTDRPHRRRRAEAAAHPRPQEAAAGPGPAQAPEGPAAAAAAPEEEAPEEPRGFKEEASQSEALEIFQGTAKQPDLLEPPSAAAPRKSDRAAGSGRPSENEPKPKPRPSRLPNLMGEIEAHLERSEAVPPADEAGWLQETARLTSFAQEIRVLLEEAAEDKGGKLKIPRESIPKREMSVHRGDKDLQWARQKLRNCEEEHERLSQLLEDPEQEHLKELRALERDIDAENKRQKQLAAENRQRERTLAKAAADEIEADGDARALMQVERLDAELQVWRTKNASLEKQVQQAAAALQKAREDHKAVGAKLRQVEEQLGGEDARQRLAEQRRISEEENGRKEAEEASLQASIARLQESRKSAARSHERHAKDAARRLGGVEAQKAELEARLAELDRLERQLRRQQPAPRRTRRSTGKSQPQREAAEAKRTEEERDVLAEFLSYMVGKHGDVVRAWRKSLDVDGDGRLRFQEFVGGCKNAGYRDKLKTLWSALDIQGKGFIELIDLDPVAGRKLDDFRDFLEESYWTLEDAWERVFDCNGSSRCTEDDFVAACERIGWPGDAPQMFGWLDLSGTNLTVDEMNIIGMRRRKEPIVSAKDRIRERHSKDVEQADAMVQKFRDFLKKRYGNLERAWRTCLDPDGDGRLQFTEFCARCRELGFQGNLKALWLSLDQKGTGYVSLDELDPEFRAASESRAALAIQKRFRGKLARATSVAAQLQGAAATPKTRHSRREDDQKKALADFLSFLVSNFGDVVRAWRKTLDLDGNGRLQFQEFLAGCKKAGYRDDLKTIWKSLDCKGKGFVELIDLDADAGQKLNDFRDFLEENYQTLEDVWERVFDSNGSGRCTKDDFVASCARIGWPGNALQMFGWLDLSGTNITLDEMDLIGMSRRAKAVMSAKERVLERQAKDAEQAAAMLQKFRDYLRKRYGSLVKAWRTYLDPDGDGKLQFTEFCAKCREMGFQGNLKALWLSLDEDGTGYVSLDELDPEFRTSGAAPAAGAGHPEVGAQAGAAAAAGDGGGEEPTSADKEPAEEPASSARRSASGARRPSSAETRRTSRTSSQGERAAPEPSSARQPRPSFLSRPSLLATPRTSAPEKRRQSSTLAPPDPGQGRRSSREPDESKGTRSSRGSETARPPPAAAPAPPRDTPRPSGAPPPRASFVGPLEPVLRTPRRSVLGQQLQPLPDAAGPAAEQAPRAAASALLAPPAPGAGASARASGSGASLLPPAAAAGSSSRASARASKSPRASAREGAPPPSTPRTSARPGDGAPPPSTPRTSARPGDGAPPGPKASARESYRPPVDAGPKVDSKGKVKRGAGRANIFSVGGSKPKAAPKPAAAAKK